MQTATGVHRREVTVQDGDNLEQVTGRAVYHDCRVGEIRTQKGREFLELRVPVGERYLKIGQAYGDVEPLAMQREMIRRTIKEHLDKELRLAPQGIKVLTPVLHRRGGAVSQVRRRWKPCEGRLCVDLRGGISPSGQAPRLPEPVQGGGRGDGGCRRARRLLLHRQEGRLDGYREVKNNQANRDNAERRLQPDYAGEGETAELRDQTEVHLLPLGARRRAGTTRTSSRFAPSAKWAPSESAGRPSGAACGSA